MTYGLVRSCIDTLDQVAETFLHSGAVIVIHDGCNFLPIVIYHDCSLKLLVKALCKV